MHIGPEDPNEERFHGFYFARCGGGGVEGGPAGGEVLGAVAIGEEPIVPDPHEALGEHVEQEAADKLLRGEAHHFGLVPMRVVSVVEADLAVLAVQDALVANGGG